MSKYSFIVLIFSLVMTAVNAEEISVGSIDCLNNGLEKIQMELFYNSDNESLILYDRWDFTMAYIFNEAARLLLLKAIAKAEEWKNVAVTNNVNQMNKEIPGIDNVKIISLANYGDGWYPAGNLINYQFLIMEYNNKIRYLFLIRARSVDDLNNGSFGAAYSFDIGES
ncbi:MAG: hypothetical protein U9N32_10075, partial [Spirochaetota bacterium]|nr:hypothetical protein [Spirochaetota bacterium]